VVEYKERFTVDAFSDQMSEIPAASFRTYVRIGDFANMKFDLLRRFS
jgi:hypothetical protein